MDSAEIRFRLAEGARVGTEALRFALGGERWRPRRLARRLNQRTPRLAAASAALRAGDLRQAEAALRAHFGKRESRFAIDPGRRETIAAAIRAEFPGAVDGARLRGDRLAGGRYDLLGHSDLSFRTPHSEETDWHFDPVHRRHAPTGFWRRVPFLDPRSGDHKIIWELNRHQHWLALGRAAWLTGDARYATAIQRELHHWMRANPPLAGVNWASMLELGFRSISWIWTLHFLLGMNDPPGTPLGVRDENGGNDETETNWLVTLLCGLDRQLEHIGHHLSRYFSPNTHLLGEALALYVGGRVLPELAQSARWAEAGRDVLLSEATRQVHADGGHVERSTHYHRYALDFYLLALVCARRTGDAAAEPFAEAAARLATYCHAIADDNGRLARIGDDDGGALFPICGREVADASDSLSLSAALLNRPDLAVSGPSEEVLWMLGGDRSALVRPAGKTIGPSKLFPETGYAVLQSPEAHAIMDVGRHGFLNGGHAHADALSLVLTVRGMPLLIDPGTATYTMDAAARDRFRSSAMHNTVVIDGRSQSEPAGPFHWKTQAHATVDRWRPARAFDYLEASHDGYLPLLHRRAVLVTRHGLWLIADHLLGGGGAHRVEMYWHLHPRWEERGTVTLIPNSGNRCDCPPFGHVAVHAAIASTAARREAFRGDADGLGWYSPVYGRVEPSLTLRFSDEILAPATLVTAIAAADLPVLVDIAPLAVVGERDGWHRAGVAVTRGGDRFIAMFATPDPGCATAGRSVHHVRIDNGTLDTDARVTLVRLSQGGEPLSVSLVDGARARWTGAGPFTIELPAPAEDLHLDLAAARRLSRARAAQPL